MKILIVDDSRAMRMIVRRTLRQAGFEDNIVDEAANATEALAAMQTFVPDIVLCDWNMPEVSGFELLQQLNHAGFTAKFGFVTSESTPEMYAMAKDAGALFFITKPFTPESFQESLEPILGT